VAYGASSGELAYLDNRSKIKYQVPKYVADEANAACRSRTSKTYAAAQPSAPSAPSHGDLQSRLKTLAADTAPQDFGL